MLKVLSVILLSLTVCGCSLSRYVAPSGTKGAEVEVYHSLFGVLDAAKIAIETSGGEVLEFRTEVEDISETTPYELHAKLKDKKVIVQTWSADYSGFENLRVLVKSRASAQEDQELAVYLCTKVKYEISKDWERHRKSEASTLVDSR